MPGRGKIHVVSDAPEDIITDPDNLDTYIQLQVSNEAATELLHAITEHIQYHVDPDDTSKVTLCNELRDIILDIFNTLNPS